MVFFSGVTGTPGCVGHVRQSTTWWGSETVVMMAVTDLSVAWSSLVCSSTEHIQCRPVFPSQSSHSPYLHNSVTAHTCTTVGTPLSLVDTINVNNNDQTLHLSFTETSVHQLSHCNTVIIRCIDNVITGHSVAFFCTLASSFEGAPCGGV